MRNSGTPRILWWMRIRRQEHAPINSFAAPMSVRADHVAGLAFVLFGLLVFLHRRDLPIGSLSFPGSGFLPKLLATLLIAFGGTLILRSAESQPFADINWNDLKHAG